MTKKCGWGIIGTGHIATKHAEAIADSETGVLAAVGSRDLASAEKFAAAHQGQRAFGSYEELLACPEVEIVYISTPHPFHAEWAIRAAEAGKHILCEKPLTLNHATSMAVVEAALANRVLLVEAFMYRSHPQTAKLISLLRKGVIGEVRMIEAAFGFHARVPDDHRLLNPGLGGGGILDVGCYPISLARLIAAVATGKECVEPASLKASGVLHPKLGVDLYAAAVLHFPGNIIAQVATGVGCQLTNEAKIYGSEGFIHIPSPWKGNENAPGEWQIAVHRKGADPEIIREKADRMNYAYQVDQAGKLVREGADHVPFPLMGGEDSLANARTLDLWKNAVGVVYPAEKPEVPRPVVHGGGLRRSTSGPIPQVPFPGLDKPVARLVMGVDNQTPAQASVMFDDYLEKGGNAFDTAWVYRAGALESILGHYLKHRGLRDDVVIVAKGAHTPHCDPASLHRQLDESLDRLQTDYADIYCLHRDNPEVPVGEFIDALNEEVTRGRMRVFGGSNWSMERLREANDYARANQKQGFSLVSNNLSLARMVSPVWNGCIAASEPSFREWLEKDQMPLLAWSSQARGFFTDRANPANPEDPELVRCWYSEENFERKKRATQLAEKYGVLPINIALAYVLRQAFPAFCLIGPRSLAETRTSLPALQVELSPAEMAWLDLRRSSPE